MNIALTGRQLQALYRVASSMNLVGARISVTGPDDLLSPGEMTNLQYRLGRHLEEFGRPIDSDSPAEPDET